MDPRGERKSVADCDRSSDLVRAAEGLLVEVWVDDEVLEEDFVSPSCEASAEESGDFRFLETVFGK